MCLPVALMKLPNSVGMLPVIPALVSKYIVFFVISKSESMINTIEEAINIRNGIPEDSPKHLIRSVLFL